jgi:two-component system cell cycle response regulator CtrA
MSNLRDELIRKLEEENDDLRRRIEMLEEQVGVRFESPPQFCFSKNESVIFGLLMKNEIVLRTSMMTELYLHKQDEALIKIVDVWICKMRRKLDPYGIRIETQWGQGYFIGRECKAKAKAILDQARAA